MDFVFESKEIRISLVIIGLCFELSLMEIGDHANHSKFWENHRVFISLKLILTLCSYFSELVLL